MMHSSISRPGTPEDSQPLSMHPTSTAENNIFENLHRMFCAALSPKKIDAKFGSKKWCYS